MSKRLSELEIEAKRRLVELEAEKKNLIKTKSFYPILDQDLEKWRAKLSKTASSKKNSDSTWKLTFFSRDYHGYDQFGFGSYWASIEGEPNSWSSQRWSESEQNCGGTNIAYAPTPEALYPPPLEAKRISLFGLIFVISPIDTELPRYTYELASECPSFTIGLPPLLDPSELTDEVESLAGIEKPDLTNPKHVETLYFYNCGGRERGLTKDKCLLEINTEIDALRKDFEAKETKLFAKRDAALALWDLRCN